MKPLFKYSGGKSRESKRIASFIGSGHTRTVEPFCGSAAVSFYLEKPALVCDVRKDVVTTLKVVKDASLYPKLQKRIDSLSNEADISALEKEFYKQRDEMWGCEDDLDVAYRFIVIRQLVFSGIDRINKKTGKENAPFGWYKRFKSNLGPEHHELLRTWDIVMQPFEATFDDVKHDDFVFSDPPYLGRNSTYGGENDINVEFHRSLQSKHDECAADWLLVHCEHPEYDDFVNRHSTSVFDFAYSQNFVGRDNAKSKTRHLYINKRKESLT